MAHWLLKSEPTKYAWERLLADGRTCWDGIRNYQARNNLKAMRNGDTCLFYHSNEGLAVVGVAKVVRQAYTDPTTADDRWVAVDVAPQLTLARPVPLAVLKEDQRTAGMALVRQGRLSVSPVTAAEYDVVLKLGGGTARPRRARQSK